MSCTWTTIVLMIFTVFYKIIVIIWLLDKNKLDILFKNIFITLNLYHLLFEQYFIYSSKHKNVAPGNLDWACCWIVKWFRAADPHTADPVWSNIIQYTVLCLCYQLTCSCSSRRAVVCRLMSDLIMKVLPETRMCYCLFQAILGFWSGQLFFLSGSLSTFSFSLAFRFVFVVFPLSPSLFIAKHFITLRMNLGTATYY